MTTTKTPRARAASAKKPTVAAPGMIAALKFVSVAQRNSGLSYQTHVKIQHGAITAFDGLITAGYPIEENLTACPQSEALSLALTRCVETLSMTLSDDMRLVVASGKYKARVPCVAEAEMTDNRPDENVHAIGEEFRTALLSASVLAKEGATELIAGSVLVTGQTVIGTNRHVMLEVYHGMNLPECGMVIPKASCVALGRVSGVLVGFGYGGDTATFWFDNGGWIKTQLMPNKWPSCDPILGAKFESWPVPDGLFEGLKAIMPLAGDDDAVTFGEDVITCGSGKGVASYEVVGVVSGRKINGKYLLSMEANIEQLDFKSDKDRAVFRGPNCRGVIAALRK